jgi:hypothetical protein
MNRAIGILFTVLALSWASTPSAQEPATATDESATAGSAEQTLRILPEGELAELREQFEADRGKARLLLILSPT